MSDDLKSYPSAPLDFLLQALQLYVEKGLIRPEELVRGGGRKTARSFLGLRVRARANGA